MSRSAAAVDWMTNLPFVLLGIRSALRDGSGLSPAHLTYGGPLRLPGEFFDVSSLRSLPDVSGFVAHLRQVLREASPFPLEYHASQAVHVPDSLASCHSVFVRVDAVKRPLTPPYCGPFRVLERGPKVFVLDRAGKPWTVSVDRLKPLLDAVPDVDPVPVAPAAQAKNFSSMPSISPSARVPAGASDSSESFPALPAARATHPLEPALYTRSGRLVTRPDFLNV